MPNWTSSRRTSTALDPTRKCSERTRRRLQRNKTDCELSNVLLATAKSLMYSEWTRQSTCHVTSSIVFWANFEKAKIRTLALVRYLASWTRYVKCKRRCIRRTMTLTRYDFIQYLRLTSFFNSEQSKLNRPEKRSGRDTCGEWDLCQDESVKWKNSKFAC